MQEFGYHDRIAEVMANTGQRVLVSLDELREYNEELCNNLLAHPFEHIPALETALREVSWSAVFCSGLTRQSSGDCSIRGVLAAFPPTAAVFRRIISSCMM